MKLEEAIRYLKDSKRVFLHKGETEYAKANHLGIKALERIDYCRSGEFEEPFELLPGETED